MHRMGEEDGRRRVGGGVGAVLSFVVDSDNGLWCHGIIFVEAGVVSVCCSGCGQSNNGCRWFLVVAIVRLAK